MDLLEAGKIINTHGIRGEVKIDPWADSPEFLLDFGTLYIDGEAYAVELSRVHKGKVLVKLAGVDSVESAEGLKNRVVSINREDAELDDGQYFLADLVGFAAVDEDGNELGRVTDILSRPGGDILEIKGAREMLVPIVPEFIKGRDPDAGTVTVHLIEGL